MNDANTNHKKQSILCAFKRATREMEATSQKDYGLCEADECSIIHASIQMEQEIAKKVFNDKKLMALAAKVAVDETKKKVSGATQQ